MFVSCIMPTRGRNALAMMAVGYWEAQTYPYRELVIIDDRDKPSFPDGIHLPNVQYHLIERRLTVGAKRNLACSRAQGEVICHWDSDDYSAPERVESQLCFLLSSGKPVTGYRSMRFTDGERNWMYSGSELYAVGTSLMYRKDYWAAHPFKDMQQGEDTDFVFRARFGYLAVIEAGEMMYATVHSDNTCPRQFVGKAWSEI